MEPLPRRTGREGDDERGGARQDDSRARRRFCGERERQASDGAGGRQRGPEQHPPRHAVGQQRRRRRRGDQEGVGQDHPHRLDAGDHGQGEQPQQQEPHQVGAQSDHLGVRRVEASEFQLLVEQGQSEQHDGCHAADEPQVFGGHAQHVAEQHVRQVAVGARAAHQQHAQREHAGEDDADGCVLLHRLPPRSPADEQGRRQRRPESAERQAPAEQVRDDEAGERRVRQGVADERHPPLDDMHAQHGAGDPHQHRRQQGVLHEGVAERLDQEVHARSFPARPLRVACGRVSTSPLQRWTVASNAPASRLRSCVATTSVLPWSRRERIAS